MRMQHRQEDRKDRMWQHNYACHLCWSAVTVVGLVLLSPLALGWSTLAQESQGSAEEDVRLVYAEAEGATLDEATQGALRTAVEQGVGVFVTSRVRVENDELIEDKILALSNGYIHSYRVVETKERGGQVLVRVVAEVGMHQIRESLEAVGVEVALSGELVLRQAALQAEQREDEIQVLSSLFYDDVQKPSVFDYSLKIDPPLRKSIDCDAWVAREREVDCREEYYEVGVTVTREPNTNYVREIENLRDLLIAILGPSHHTENWYEVAPRGRVPLASPVDKALVETNVFQNAIATRDDYKNGAVGLDVLREPKMVGQNLSGPRDETFFPDAAFLGGYVVVVPDPNSFTTHGFLLRSAASAFIIANYINQVFYAHNLALELDGTRALRLTSDPILDLCRSAHITAPKSGVLKNKDVREELLPTLLWANYNRTPGQTGIRASVPVVGYTRDWISPRAAGMVGHRNWALLIVDVPGNDARAFSKWGRARLGSWSFNIPFLLQASVLEGIESVNVEPLEIEIRNGLLVSTTSLGEQVQLVAPRPGKTDCEEIQP